MQAGRRTHQGARDLEDHAAELAILDFDLSLMYMYLIPLKCGMGALTSQRGELEQTCFFAADNVQGDSWAGCHLPQPKVQISGTGRARAPACRLVGVQGGWHSHGWYSCSWSNSAPPARPHPHHPVSCPRADLQGQTATQSATAAHGRSAKATATCRRRRQGCRPTATIK